MQEKARKFVNKTNLWKSSLHVFHCRSQEEWKCNHIFHIHSKVETFPEIENLCLENDFTKWEQKLYVLYPVIFTPTISLIYDRDQLWCWDTQ